MIHVQETVSPTLILDQKGASDFISYNGGHAVNKTEFYPVASIFFLRKLGKTRQETFSNVSNVQTFSNGYTRLESLKVMLRKLRLRILQWPSAMWGMLIIPFSGHKAPSLHLQGQPCNSDMANDSTHSPAYTDWFWRGSCQEEKTKNSDWIFLEIGCSSWWSY